MNQLAKRSIVRKDGVDYVTLTYPGGYAIRFGGTRTFDPDRYLNRWWQHSIEKARLQAPCQFHSKPQTMFSENLPTGIGDKCLDVIQNNATPYLVHRLFIPHGECWSEEEIRKVGGLDCLTAVIGYAVDMMRQESYRAMRLVFYSGHSAGMTQQDFHVHFIAGNKDSGYCDPTRFSDLKNFLRTDTEFRIDDTDNLVVSGASIYRAGQCFLVSSGNSSSAEIAYAISAYLLEPFGRVFKSHQGLPPDCTVQLEFKDGVFDWGYYGPVLNIAGAEQQDGFGASTYVHPWGPDETVRLVTEAAK